VDIDGFVAGLGLRVDGVTVPFPVSEQ
jgi:hypothetical protein